jgi:hypothetical protein
VDLQCDGVIRAEQPDKEKRRSAFYSGSLGCHSDDQA